MTGDSDGTMNSILAVAALISLADYGLSARILAVTPFPGKSHHIFISTILKAISQKGHEIVEYSPFPPSQTIPNYKHIEIHTKYEKAIDNWTFEDFVKIALADRPRIKWGFRDVWDFTYPICEEVFKLKEIQQLLHSEEHFDLVITESTFGQESMVVFGYKFNAPVITLQAFNTWSALNRDAGNSLSIASIPDPIAQILTNQMTFLERAQNMLSTLMTLYAYYNYHLPLHEGLIKRVYSGSTPPLVDMVGNISLYLINSHPYVNYPQPLSPNIVPVGGITVSPERVPLPQDIQKFMDEAKDGVVYFSLGTVVPSALLPKEIIQIFVNVFKTIPQRVLWKIELDSIPGLSKNVMTSKWFPQPGVLGHSKCVAFITHGGLFGQQEALFAGVPTIGIPFFGDQQLNVKFSEHRGFGTKLDFETLSEDALKTALDTVLSNPQYKKNAEKLSQIFRDRPNGPSEQAVWWVEYVLRYRGAQHLRPAATSLAWYSLALLDVLGAIIAVIILSMLLLYWILTRIMALVRGHPRKKNISNTKKNK